MLRKKLDNSVKQEKNPENKELKSSQRTIFLIMLTIIVAVAFIFCTYYIIHSTTEKQTYDVQTGVNLTENENIEDRDIDERDIEDEDSEDKDLDKERLAKEKSEGSRRNKGYISYYPTTPKIITNEDDAMKVLEDIQDELGIYNVSEEYYFSSKRNFIEQVSYSMQQRYNGIDVDGGVITLNTDKSGNLLSVNGYYHNLQNFNAKYSLSEEDAADYLRKYMSSGNSWTEDNFSYEKVALKIFDFDNKNVVAYRFDIGIQVIIIDANNGKVLSDYSNIDY